MTTARKPSMLGAFINASNGDVLCFNPAELTYRWMSRPQGAKTHWLNIPPSKSWVEALGAHDQCFHNLQYDSTQVFVSRSDIEAIASRLPCPYIHKIEINGALYDVHMALQLMHASSSPVIRIVSANKEAKLFNKR